MAFNSGYFSCPSLVFTIFSNFAYGMYLNRIYIQLICNLYDNMKRYLNKKAFVGLTTFIALILVAFSGSHPVTGTGGYTGAPGDSACTQCHSPGGSLDGTMLIEGLPTTIDPSTTYPLTVTITDTSPGGTAVRSGFQIVSLKQNLANAGTFAVAGSETNASVKMIAGKSYVGHQPSKNFDSNDEVVFEVEWTSPSSATGPITLYGASIIANGSNGNSNDKFVTNQAVTEISTGTTPLSVTFSNVADALCSDSSDGSATVNATGGTGGYSYAWDNGESNQTAIALSPGDHDVTVTDNTNNAIVQTVTIGAPPAIVLETENVSDASCNATNTGTATIIANGGVGGFDYDWGSGISGPVQTSLFAGVYTVTVTDNNQCEATTEITISEPNAIDITVVSLQEPSCNGESDGQLEVLATGGNGGYTYTWLPAVGNPTDAILSNIPAGTYTAEVIDTEGCTSSLQVTIGEPAAIQAAASSTDVSCLGGTDGGATVIANGGTPSYAYQWSNGETTQTIDDLTSGTYTVTVTDMNGCIIEASASVNEPSSPVTAGISVIQQSNCGNSDGSMSGFGDGGTPGYTYEWSTGSSLAVIEGIPSGTYTLTVTDLLGCTAVAEQTLSDADGVSIAANDVSNVSCNGGDDGSATISASSANGGYIYTWSNGGDQQTESNLEAGIYSITVADASGCTGVITIEILEPEAITIDSSSQSNITCNGLENGTLEVIASGGTGELSYEWNIGVDQTSIAELVAGFYDVTITDELGCEAIFDFVIEEPEAIAVANENISLPSCAGDSDGSIIISIEGGTLPYQYLWNDGSTNDTIAGISSGDYSVTITDNNQCTAVLNYTIDDPSEVFVTVTAVAPLCAESSDGSLTLDIEGGSSPYSVGWEDGGMSTTRDSLSSGTYEATVTDANGCSAVIMYDIAGPPPIEPNVTTTDESANGATDGSAVSDPIFGTEPYTYAWSNGDTSNMISDLSPGMYSVTVTDSQGCSGVQAFNINSGDCNLSGEPVITNVSCAGQADGQINVTVEGAVEPLTYVWSNGDSMATLSDLESGMYSVIITDANGCQLQLTDLEISEPSMIAVTDFEIINPSTPSASDGEVVLTVEGGTGDYTFELADDSQIGLGIERLDSLVEGTYYVIITDENGCRITVGPYVLVGTSSTYDLTSIVSVYPNPATSQLNVDIIGELDYAPILIMTSGEQHVVTYSKVNSGLLINTERLAGGIYFLRVSIDKQVYLKKVIVL